jgi:acyl-CoA thioesterase
VKAGLKIHLGDEYTTFRGILHGGISAVLADTAMGWAVMTLGRTCVTVDMYTNYLAPAFGEHGLSAEAQVVYSGKKMAVAEANLYNDKGEMVVKSRGTFYLKNGKMQEFYLAP